MNLLRIELGHLLKTPMPSPITTELVHPSGHLLRSHPGLSVHRGSCRAQQWPAVAVGCSCPSKLISAARVVLCFYFRSILDDSARTWPVGFCVQGHRILNYLAQSRLRRACDPREAVIFELTMEKTQQPLHQREGMLP